MGTKLGGLDGANSYPLSLAFGRMGVCMCMCMCVWVSRVRWARKKEDARYITLGVPAYLFFTIFRLLGDSGKGVADGSC